MKVALLLSAIGWAAILAVSLMLANWEKTVGALWGGGISIVDMVILYVMVARLVQSKGFNVLWLGLVVLKFLALLTAVGVVVLLVKMDILFFLIALGLIPVSMVGASLKLALEGSVFRE